MISHKEVIYCWQPLLIDESVYLLVTVVAH